MEAEWGSSESLEVDRESTSNTNQSNGSSAPFSHSHAPDNGRGHSHAHAGQGGSLTGVGVEEAPVDEEEEAERLHFLKVARTYASYAHEHIHRFVEKRLADVSGRDEERAGQQNEEGQRETWAKGKGKGGAEGVGRRRHRVSERHQRMLEECGFFARHHKIEECVRVNQQFLNEVIRDVMHMFQDNNPLQHTAQLVDDSGDSFVKYLFSHSTDRALPSQADHEKMRTTLRQLVRDWSIEGSEERANSYAPIIEQIKARFGDREDKSSVEIVVPGAGLGRLAFELAALGFKCQGSEWSVFMLYSSSFILNHTLRAKQYTIYPWATQPSNQFSQLKQCKAVQIPDVNPRDALSFSTSSLHQGTTPNFSMSAGDFLEVYGNQRNCWDCIASCFFLDTARNVIEYLELMFRLLKPGGCLINLGPLLYHYTDMYGELSVELTFEELLLVIKRVGFVIDKVDYSHQSPYLDNQNNMLTYNYKTPLLVAVKPKPATYKNSSPPPSSHSLWGQQHKTPQQSDI